MQTDLFSVSKLFTENLYRIPDYQRGYAWTERQLKDFWSDLELLEPNSKHYLGVLTLEEAPDTDVARWDDDRWIIESRHFAPYYVVDGQQRLTTVVILLQCIIERLPDGESLNYTDANDIRRKFIFESKDSGISRSYLFGYERDNPSYEFLKTHIFLEASDNHALPEETIYTHNLRFAKEYFAEKLKDLSGNDLAVIYTKITQAMLFNVYAISHEVDVFVAFETMNNRGKQLSNLELLKNRLIYLSTRLNSDGEERRKLRTTINESWKTLYHYLGRNKKKPLNDDIFLNTHYWLYFRPSLEQNEDDREAKTRWYSTSNDYKDELLEKIFTTRNLPRSPPSPTTSLSVQYFYDYSKDIKELVKQYYEIHNPEHGEFSGEEKIWLTRLGRLGDADDKMLLLSIFRSDSAANHRLRGRSPDLRLTILTLYERMLFLETIVGYISSDDKPQFAHLAAQLTAGSIDLDGVVKEFSSYEREVLKKKDPLKNIQEWTKYGGGYRWPGVRYFLFEYEQTLRASSKTHREKLNWDEFSREDFKDDYVTVEHILPQKTSADGWRDIVEPFTIKERNILKNSLGNLVPLSRGKNSALGVLPFDQKKRGIDNTVGYAFGCYSENELCNVPEWNAKEILLRGIKLLRFLEKRWNVSLGDNMEKASALGLDFVFRRYRKLEAQLQKDE